MPLWGAALSLIEQPVRFLNLPYKHESHDALITAESRSGTYHYEMPFLLVWADHQNSHHHINSRVTGVGFDHQHTIETGVIPYNSLWSKEKTHVYVVGTLRCDNKRSYEEQIVEMPLIYDNIALMQSYFTNHTTIFYADEKCETVIRTLWRQPESRLEVLRDYPKIASDFKTHRIAFGRNALLKRVHEFVSERQQDTSNVFVVMMDVDEVNRSPFNMKTFGCVIHNHSMWDGVSFRREPFHDIRSLRYEPYVMNHDYALVRNNTVALKTIDTVRDDITRKLTKSTFVTVDSAFSGLAIYRYNSILNCTYDGYNREISDELLQQGLRDQWKTKIMVEECEHVSFHKCMREKHNARIVIYNQTLTAW